MHQPAALAGPQSAALFFAHRLKGGVRQAQHMELVHDDRGVWQHHVDGLLVWAPHVHGDELDALLVGQALEEGRHGRPAPIAQQIEHGSLPDVG